MLNICTSWICLQECVCTFSSSFSPLSLMKTFSSSWLMPSMLLGTLEMEGFGTVMLDSGICADFDMDDCTVRWYKCAFHKLFRNCWMYLLNTLMCVSVCGPELGWLCWWWWCWCWYSSGGGKDTLYCLYTAGLLPVYCAAAGAWV